MLIVTLLIGIGIIMIYSSSAIFAFRYWNNELRFLQHHLIYLSIASLFFLFSSYYPYQKYSKWIPFLLIVCFLLLVLVLIPGIGSKISGARRWIRFAGLGIQPSEVLKIILIFWVSYFLKRKKNVLTEFSKGLLPSIIILMIYLSLLLLQPDFGNAVLITFTLLLMAFVGGVKPFHVFTSISVAIVVGCFLIATSAYRMKRITAFLSPWEDPLDSGYQLINSLVAYGSGGIFGKGFGASQQKLYFLPQAHTDFIFSIIAEETGFIGITFIIGIFVLFCITGFQVAISTEETFGKNLAFGITTLLTLQGIIHLCVVVGLLPTKGIGFPFISYGGSSLCACMFMTGVLVNIAKQNITSHN